ncbi:cupin domain-containing protein [Albimonas pacifica]|uniref:Cupin domain protein n=1 Tax=Albimonas pacifica TaxID=1114924 RepID=A0A1I3BPZ4_9RHOB|nr:cupin domain-containing protein [Albimonas pacifica]SFH64146.1 Cupin domain protein [Albimonas pacifica]
MRAIARTAAACLAACLLTPAPALADGGTITLVYDQPIPNLPGKSLKGVLVEYAPGGYSPAHVHAPSALIYATVLEGAVRMQINGGESRVYRALESFTEMPGDFHDVSSNASTSEPAKLLAVFVVNSDETELTTFRPHR